MDHPVFFVPGGGRKAKAISIGAAVLASDPAVRRIAIRGVAFQNPFQHQGYAAEAEGEVQGLQSAIVEVLAARGLRIDDAFRAALNDERDIEALKALLRRAMTAASTVELLPPSD
jgi:hypothetical protein